MVIYEFRQSAYNKAFDLIEDAMQSNKKNKLALCELYDCLMDCYETDVDEYPEDEEYEDEPYGDTNYAEIGEVEVGEINYRDDDKHTEHPYMRRNMRRGIRKGMRHAMKGGMRHSNVRSRRLGRYSY